MTNLDLTEAIEQAVKDIHDDFTVETGYGEYDSTAVWGTPRSIAKTVLTAALPAILTALAELADEETVGLTGVHEETKAWAVVDWLRAKAEEARA